MARLPEGENKGKKKDSKIITQRNSLKFFEIIILNSANWNSTPHPLEFWFTKANIAVQAY